jgi:hypothetical protein
MTAPQELKYRGNFKEFDSRGYDVVYNVGDVVVFDGKQYVATIQYKKSIPTKKQSGWKQLTADFENYYYSDIQPLHPNKGDRWIDRLTGRMYTYMEDTNGFHWVEF